MGCSSSAEGVRFVLLGIQFENAKQAWDRADLNRKDKGGGAAEAALAMVALRQEFGVDVETV